MSFLLDIFNWFAIYPQNLFGNLNILGFFIVLIILALLNIAKASSTVALLVLIPVVVILTFAQMLPAVVMFIFGLIVAFFIFRGVIRVPQN